MTVFTKEDFVVYEIAEKYVLVPKFLDLRKWKFKTIKEIDAENLVDKKFMYFVYLKEDGGIQKNSLPENFSLNEINEIYERYWKNLNLSEFTNQDINFYEIGEDNCIIPRKIEKLYLEKQIFRYEVKVHPDHYISVDNQGALVINKIKEAYRELNLIEIISIYKDKWTKMQDLSDIGKFSVYKIANRKILIPDFISLKRIGLEYAQKVNEEADYYLYAARKSVGIQEFPAKHKNKNLYFIVEEYATNWRKLYRLSSNTKLNKLNIGNKVTLAEKEGKRLKENLPDILLKLGLKNIEGDNEYIYSYSKIGDELLRNDLREFNLKNKLQTELNSNLQQKWALIRLGFDFLDISDHMGGTYFEVLYALAHEQNKQNVKNLLLKSLLGDLYIDKNKFINWLKNLLRKK